MILLPAPGTTTGGFVGLAEPPVVLEAIMPYIHQTKQKRAEYWYWEPEGDGRFTTRSRGDVMLKSGTGSRRRCQRNER